MFMIGVSAQRLEMVFQITNMKKNQKINLVFEHGSMEGKSCSMRWRSAKLRTAGIIMIIIFLGHDYRHYCRHHHHHEHSLHNHDFTSESYYWQGFDGLFSQQGGGQTGPGEKSQMGLQFNNGDGDGDGDGKW